MEAHGLFRHDTAQSELGASIFWVNAETSFADTEDLIIGWQTRRELQRRGIVEVVEHDIERVNAEILVYLKHVPSTEAA